MHLGDHDPSGLSIFDVLNEDVTEFVNSGKLDGDGTVEFHRIAVTEGQIADLDLITQPRKKNDKKAYVGIFGDRDSTCQIEAIPPDELSRIVMDEVEQLIDEYAHMRALAHEKKARKKMGKQFEKMMG